MKEQLITFETAKLAKKKGFDFGIIKCRCITFLSEEDEDYGVFAPQVYEEIPELYKNQLLAPTQSFLQKWLLEKHHINIELTFDDGQWFIYVGEFSFPDSSVEFVDAIECDGFNDAIKQKPMAKEKALQHALKLI